MPARDAVAQGGDEAILQLSQAMLLLRPQAPAWSFTPLPRSVRRLPEGSRGQRMLALDLAIALVKRRTPGEGLGVWFLGSGLRALRGLGFRV
jgi:hypothetical protein